MFTIIITNYNYYMVLLKYHTKDEKRLSMYDVGDARKKTLPSSVFFLLLFTFYLNFSNVARRRQACRGMWMHVG